MASFPNPISGRRSNHTLYIPRTYSNKEKSNWSNSSLPKRKRNLVLLLRGKCNMWTMLIISKRRPRHPPFWDYLIPSALGQSWCEPTARKCRVEPKKMRKGGCLIWHQGESQVIFKNTYNEIRMAERLKSRRALISCLLAWFGNRMRMGSYYIYPDYVCYFVKPGKKMISFMRNDGNGCAWEKEWLHSLSARLKFRYTWVALTKRFVCLLPILLWGAKRATM